LGFEKSQRSVTYDFLRYILTYLLTYLKTLRKQHDLTDNNAMINEFTSGATYGMKCVLNKQQNRESKLRREIITQ